MPEDQNRVVEGLCTAVGASDTKGEASFASAMLVGHVIGVVVRRGGGWVYGLDTRTVVEEVVGSSLEAAVAEVELEAEKVVGPYKAVEVD